VSPKSIRVFNPADWNQAPSFLMAWSWFFRALMHINAQVRCVEAEIPGFRAVMLAADKPDRSRMDLQNGIPLGRVQMLPRSVPPLRLMRGSLPNNSQEGAAQQTN